MTTDPVFDIREDVLAERLNIERRRLTETRRADLEPGVDFRLVGGRIAFCERGAVRLLAALGLPDDAKVALVACRPASDALSEAPAVLVVVRQTKNRRVVLARRKDRADGPLLRLVVPRADNFWPKMEVPECFRDPSSVDLWRYRGRCPRRRGRW